MFLHPELLRLHTILIPDGLSPVSYTHLMAAGHDKAACEVKLAEFTDDIEAIKNGDSIYL